jgi:hypothetical protein
MQWKRACFQHLAWWAVGEIDVYANMRDNARYNVVSGVVFM